ncbi:diadenylate cyclase [Halorubrum sp. SY-15]|jgi:hypothetical protein|uniref:diadenylate cyclase n=1 Tax=Halorubrum sp. SY-15 TaxID=3402277 RepID=UPI003EBEFD7F
MDALDRVQKRFATSQALMDQVRYAAESLSLNFDRWDEPHVSGPSLYVLIVAEMSFDHYTDPLGGNEWPTDRCRLVTDSLDKFTEVARDVALTRDGAIVVSADGTIQRQMVRVRNPSLAETEENADVTPTDWMGTKHLSALETSLREEVIWVITLSEEDGRVTTFFDGTYQDYPRSEIGGRWRPG